MSKKKRKKKSKYEPIETIVLAEIIIKILLEILEKIKNL